MPTTRFLLLLAVLVCAGASCSPQLIYSLAPVDVKYMRVIDEMPAGADLDQWVYVPGIELPKGPVIYDCGPETLTAVFQYWGQPMTIDEVAQETYVVKNKGTLSIDLMLFSRRKGFAAEIRKGTLLGIQKALLKGIPPLIMLDVATLPVYNMKVADPKSKYHFLVVTGYNDTTQEVMCELYEGQKVLIHYRFLRKAWDKTGNFLLLVAPPKRFEMLKG